MLTAEEEEVMSYDLSILLQTLLKHAHSGMLFAREIFPRKSGTASSCSARQKGPDWKILRGELQIGDEVFF